MINKNISFLLACIFAFIAMFAGIPGVYASTITLSDCDYENAYGTLKTICPDFPLTDGETLSDASPVTRAEFVASVTMALNMPSGTTADSGFSDVPADHEYASHISYAAGLGLINSVDLFYPDSPVSYEQAIKILMVATGYGQKAEYSGGYPTGYLAVAREAGVGKITGAGNNDLLSPDLAIRLIFEACCIDILELSSFGSSYEYSTTKGKNIFSVYHKIYMAEGVAEANENTGLYSAHSCSADNTIQINGKSFACDNGQNFIGKNVRTFFKDDSKNTLVYIYEKDNAVYEYNENDHISVNGTAVTVSPDDADKDIRHRLEADYTVIYNGKYYGAADYSDVLNPQSGTVTFIDNNDNGNIDVIIIKEYTYCIVSSVNEFEEKIYDKYKQNGMINLGEGDVKYFCINSDGEHIELYQIKPGSAIAYAVSKDNKLYEIVSLSERVGGTYSSRTSDGKIVVADKEYKLSQYYVDNVKSIDGLKFGCELILHLSLSGQVVYAEEYSGSLHYGFVVAAGTNGGLDSKPMVKLYGDDGNMKELVCADKVKIDGVNKASSSEILSVLTAIADSQYAYRVIKYSLNAGGELNKIFTPVENADGTGAIYSQVSDESRPVIYYDATKIKDGIDLDTVKYLEETTVSENGNRVTYECVYTEPLENVPFYFRGAFLPYFHLESSAVAMQVPVRPQSFSDDENFRILDKSKLEEETLRVAAYDVSTGGVASFVLVNRETTSGGAINRYSDSAIIESITSGLNPDGEEATVLKLYYDGTWGKYYYDPDVTVISKDLGNKLGTQAQTEITINDFAPGDIIRLSANSDNVLAEMTMSFDASKKYVPEELAYVPSKTDGDYVEYITGYALGISEGKQAMLAVGMTIDEIDALGGRIPVSQTFSGVMSRGATLFVTLNRDRKTNEPVSAVVSTESDLSSLETYFNSGTRADYIVLKQFGRDPVMNVVYVNMDE